MGKVAIVTDSTAYIPQEYIEQYQIRVVPLSVHWGDKTYRDGVDIEPAEFYDRLKTDRQMPTTSAHSIGAFQQVYHQALESAETVVSIHLSSQLSATFSSAEQAKTLLPDTAVEVLDSSLTSMALGFMVLAAARAAERGESREQVVAAARRLIETSRILFTVDTLEYLRRGGRIGAAQAFMGNLMDVKPLMELRAGRVEPVERVRTKKKAVERIVDMICQHAESLTNGRPVRLAVLHALVPEEAAVLLEMAASRLNVVEKITTGISPVIASHTGPGTIGLVCSPA
jgi:DegV family protein with EDD domain